MAKSVISNEAELSMAVNAIEMHAEFLINAIEEYNAILQKVQEMGIEDDLIRKELSDIAEQINKFKPLLSACAREISAYVQSGMDEIAIRDNLNYPETDFNTIRRLISQFV